jgi:hypothetical protein
MFCPEEGNSKYFRIPVRSLTLLQGRWKPGYPSETSVFLNDERSQWLFCPEIGGKRFPQNVDTYVPNSTASQS